MGNDGNSYNLSLRQKQSNSDIPLSTLIFVLPEQPPVPMNNSVVFAGFAATSPATRIVDAHAKLVIATDAGKRAGKFVQAVVKGKPWAIVRRSDYDFFEGELDQLYTGSQKV